jgi:hypothetical protein
VYTPVLAPYIVIYTGGRLRKDVKNRELWVARRGAARLYKRRTVERSLRKAPVRSFGNLALLLAVSIAFVLVSATLCLSKEAEARPHKDAREPGHRSASVPDRDRNELKASTPVREHNSPLPERESKPSAPTAEPASKPPPASDPAPNRPVNEHGPELDPPVEVENPGSVESVPTDPTAADPAPTVPAPAEPSPPDPAPTEPKPAEPSPPDPAPAEHGLKVSGLATGLPAAGADVATFEPAALAEAPAAPKGLISGVLTRIPSPVEDPSEFRSGQAPAARLGGSITGLPWSVGWLLEGDRARSLQEVQSTPVLPRGSAAGPVRPADSPAGGGGEPRSRTDEPPTLESFATELRPLVTGNLEGAGTQVPPGDTLPSSPVAPAAPAPGGEGGTPAPASSYLGQSSGSSSGSSLLLLGISGLLSLLLRVGNLSWTFRDLPKPNSIPSPVLERPG